MAERIVVVGRGAVGATIVGILASGPPAQVLVQWVGRDTSSDSDTIELSGSVSRIVHTAGRVKMLNGVPADLTGSIVLVCTKAFDLTSLLESIHTSRPPAALVVLCNGLGVAALVERILPTWPLVRGVVQFGVKRAEMPSSSGYVVTGAPLLRLASVDSLVLSETMGELSKRGIECEREESIDALEWRKGIVNVVVNSIATLFDRENRIVLEEPVVSTWTAPAFNEVCAIAKGQGLPMTGITWEWFAKLVVSVSSNINSTLADVRAGRRTELPFLLGVARQRAAALGIATPILDRLESALTSRS